jgi:molybdenum cofactor cytidylyltransferase
VIGGIVLAAGASTRFGGRKQLAEFNGRPLLEHALRAMAAAGVPRTIVVLGSGASEVLVTVKLHGVKPIVCERWQEGQSASHACALAELHESDAVVVTIGDQPRISPEAIRRVLDARCQAPAVRATYGGRPGHPVVIERKLFERLRHATGDHGARDLLRDVGADHVACDDLGGGEDVDTRAELDALGAGGVT